MCFVGVLHLNVCWLSFGFPQVQTPDHEKTHNSSEARRACVSRRRGGLCATPGSFSRLILSWPLGYRLLPRTLDPPCHHFIRSCVQTSFRSAHAQTACLGAASFTIYTETKDYFRANQYLDRNSVLDAALVGGIGGAMSGSLISFGSARASIAFPSVNSAHETSQHLSSSRSYQPVLDNQRRTEWISQVRRQLEYTIAASKGVHIVKVSRN
jgi:hypothetical protein